MENPLCEPKHHQIVIAFDSNQMIDAIERNTGKIVNRAREDLVFALVSIIQQSLDDSDPKGFLGGMMLVGWESLFNQLAQKDDLFLDV